VTPIGSTGEPRRAGSGREALAGRAVSEQAAPAAPPGGVRGIDHVQLAAPQGCEAAARRFYGGVLGLREIPKPEALRRRGGVWFQAGCAQLHIGVEEPFRAARRAHPALRVEPAGLDALAAALAVAGAPVTWDDDLPGTRRFYCEDPWGNRLELLSEAWE